MPPQLLLQQRPDEHGWYHGTVDWETRTIRVKVVPDAPDSAQVADAMALARRLVAALADHDGRARHRAAEALLDTYNKDWRDDDDDDDDDDDERIGPGGSAPPLSAAEFVQRLTLHAVSVTSGASANLFYADGGLFGGDSVVVTTFDGGTTWRDAKLFG
jgi:hypothetical protein